MNEQSEEQRPGPVGQFPARTVGIPLPAGSPSFPSVEPPRVCSNLLETAAQLRPDLRGYDQLASQGQVCTSERQEVQEKAERVRSDERVRCNRGGVTGELRIGGQGAMRSVGKNDYSPAADE